MPKNAIFNGGLSYDLTSSRLVRLWLGLELLLILISFILLFFMPEAAGWLFLVVFCAVLLTLGAGVFLFVRYSLIPVVKDKRTYITERSKILKKVSKTKTEISKIKKTLATNQINENQEIAKALQKIHKEYIETGLTGEKIETGNISGVGPKLKEKLKANGIISAADIGLNIQNLEGFGKAKVQALLNWKESVLSQLESTKPDKLPDIQLSEIQQRYKRQRDNLTKTRESHQLRQTECGLELEAVNRNLSRFTGVNFINYLRTNLFGGINNRFSQSASAAILMSVIGLGVLIYGAFGIISSRALLVASVPAPTLTSTITHTPTQIPTSTVTVSPSSTITSTITLTPSITRTPTEDLSFYNVSDCLPKNTLFQKGTVVQIVDGDTIQVRLEDGNTYRVRYIGVDAPESERPYYTESKKANSDLVLNKEIILVKDVSETDQFDRLLRYVIVKNIFVNLELVKMGFAVAETYPPDVACADTFSAIQNVTRGSQIGIWIATQTPEPSFAQVVIISVNKSAEYVDIKNVGNIDVNLGDWKLVSEKGNQSCSLSGTINVGVTLRIWAGTAQGAGYGCGFGTSIWNNSESDPAVLYNAQGVEVSRK
ncbi:MAG: hypothetical protein A2X24_11680 [Chloroflexi bacterium GWB2_54_36]|nr:MAG: hypothetical protein A2X24_11680 [Chloroflexi bacterium GWB2_54_36]